MDLNLPQALDILKTETVVPAEDEETHLSGCFAADLMSDVLAFACPGSLLLSGLTTPQTIRTAAIKGLAAVVVIEGKEVGSDLQEAAREEGVGLYVTFLSKYEACGLLMQSGLRPYRKEVRLSP
jgi:hypothetical protein